jgi:opacity protein-like surface antigen
MKMFSLLLVALMALGSVVMAQEEEETVKDFMEVAIYGGGSLPVGGLTDWSTTNPTTGTEELGTKFGFDAGFDVGHFLTPTLVLGLNFTYGQYGIDSDSAEVASLNHRLICPSLYLKYYFAGESNFMPYVKLHAGVDVAKYTTRVYDGNEESYVYRELSYDPAPAFGIGGGVFYYTFDYGGVYAEANYHMALTSDVKGKYGDLEYNFGETASVLEVHAGVKVFFGGE